jgi:DNA mismatch repair protein MutL
MTSGRPIRLLSAEVANKIAAGEVVERPASVLKELLENALDAAASRIDIEITAGGRKFIGVSDDGSGMERDDALLSVERHATSKIRAVEDLERIATLGFRGEALAAICSVSRFRLRTRRAESLVGTEITVSGGKMLDVRDSGGPVGTAVEVRDLFFNVPARRKFLRSAETELAHLRQTFIMHALGHPAVAMTLKIDGREAHRLAAGTVDDRIRDLFGAAFQKNLRPMQHEAGGVRVSGHAGLPAVSRSDRSEEYVFVNGRPASAALLGHAIREGYRTLLPRDRYPCIFLFVTLDPALVDVNVHPTKREVRFRHPAEVRDAAIAAIRGALESGGTAAPRPGAAVEHDAARAFTAATQEPLIRIENLPVAPSFRYPRLPLAEPPEPLPSPAGEKAPAPAGTASTPHATGSGAPEAPASPWSWCRVLGQIGSLYVILETEDGYVIMDPHAAHERVLFERFMNAVERGAVQTQGLLVPETVDLMPKDAACVRRSLELLKAMGFGVSEFGGDTFVVDAMPACFAGASAAPLLGEVAQSLERAGGRGSRHCREEAVAQAACKAAVKARDRLTLAEIEQLVVELAATSMPYTCPHGRPTLIYTSFKDLNRKFGRPG